MRVPTPRKRLTWRGIRHCPEMRRLRDSCGDASVAGGPGPGGVFHVVREDHPAAGTFLLDMDQVLVGPDSERRRAAETGRGLPEPASIVLDIAGPESLIATARLRFQPILAVVPPPRADRPTKHRLLRLIESIEQNIQDLRAGGDTVDVRSAVRLRRAVLAFARWAQDPVSSRLMQESVQPETFDHNVELLEVASLLEDAGLAPEFVLTGPARTPDLILRVSATQLIELDVKTPRSGQLPAADQCPQAAGPTASAASRAPQYPRSVQHVRNLGHRR